MTGIGNGNAVVFATIEGRIGSAVVNVRQVAVTSVTVTPSTNNIAVGGNVQLTATVRAGQTVLTDRIVGWTSSNESIATVSSISRIASTAAPSADSFSPRPIQREHASAAYSVVRTSSIARLRSGRAVESGIP